MSRKYICLSKDQEEEICQLYDDLSIKQIAQQFNVCSQTVSNILERNNVPRRVSGNPSWSRDEYYCNPWASLKIKRG